MLTYRRKRDSGKLIMQKRAGGHKSRMASMKVLHPGDVMQVERKEDLPGYPNAMFGWELVDGASADLKNLVPNPKKDYMGVKEALPQAELQAVRVRGDQWKVIIKEPGLNYVSSDKVKAVLPSGTKVHPGFLTKDRAEAWAEKGYDTSLSPEN